MPFFVCHLKLIEFEFEFEFEYDRNYWENILTHNKKIKISISIKQRYRRAVNRTMTIKTIYDELFNLFR